MYFNLLQEAQAYPIEIRREVLSRLAQGQTKAQIERDMNIPYRTLQRIQSSNQEMPLHAKEVEDRHKKIIELTYQNIDNATIGTMLGATERTVRRDKDFINKNLSKYGLDKPLPVYQAYPFPSEEIIEKIISMYENGENVRDIVLKLNLPHSTVLRVLQEPKYNVRLIKRPWGLDRRRAIKKDSRLGTFADFFRSQAGTEGDDEYLTKGKIHDRYESLNAIAGSISGPPSRLRKNINVLSLPHSYLFEKSLLDRFNFNTVNVYGFDLPAEKEAQTQRALDIYNNSQHRIIPHLQFGNINNALLTNSFDFKTLRPHATYGYGFFKPSPLPENNFDIIDLDYKKYPGTIPSMRPNADINPWFGPVLAAKNLLKTGGVVMVTYLADSWREKEKGVPPFSSVMATPNNKMSVYNKTLDASNALYFDPSKPSNNIIRSFAKRPNKEDALTKYYNRAATSSNIYTQNILDYAAQEGVRLQPLWVNIYPGGTTSYMYRAIFKKI